MLRGTLKWRQETGVGKWGPARLDSPTAGPAHPLAHLRLLLLPCWGTIPAVLLLATSAAVWEAQLATINIDASVLTHVPVLPAVCFLHRQPAAL